MILSGRNESPANVLIRVSSEDSWSGLPEVAAPVPINNGGLVRWPEFHPDFLVAENPCAGVKRSEYRFVLYRRTTLSGAEEPLGLLPYPVEAGSSMVWSPDRRYIYLGQRALGRYSVSRLQLPAGD